MAEWTPGTHLEDLVLSGLPHPALAAAMIADAADALAVAHRAGRPHLRLTPRSVRWDHGSGLKITGLGLDAALCGSTGTGAAPGVEDPVAADTTALARMLYALLTGYWPGDEPTALPPAPRHKGHVCTPRQVRAGVPALLDAIAYRALQGQAADAPLRPQTPAGLAMALRMVQRPSYQLERPESGPAVRPRGPGASGGRGTPGPAAPGSAPRCCARRSRSRRRNDVAAELLGAGQGVGQVAGQAVPGGQHLADPGGRVPGQLARGLRLLAGQVLHLVEEIFQLAGVGIPAVVRIAVAGFGGQPGEDVIELGAQLGGRVGTGADPGEHRGDRVRARRPS